MGNFRQFFSISTHKANTTELHPKVRPTCFDLIPFQSGTSEEKPAAAAEEAAAGSAGARGRAPPHSPPPPRPRSCGRPARGPGAGAGDGGLEAGGHPQHGQGRGQ